MANRQQGFLSDLGGEDNTTLAQRELAQRASILGAMLKDQEARWLSGEPLHRQAVALCAEYEDFARRVENGVDVREQSRLPRYWRPCASTWRHVGIGRGLCEVCTLVNSEGRVMANM